MTAGRGGRTWLIPGPCGPLELLVRGTGDPVTVFAPGLGESITSTRPFGSGVAGTKAFFHFGGSASARDVTAPAAQGADADGGARRRHGPDTIEPSGWERHGAELLAVADHVGATRAVGASMGAVAILTALAGPGRDPHRFDRIVLLLPPAVNGGRLRMIAELLERGDAARLTELLRAERESIEHEDPRVDAWLRGAVERMADLGPRRLEKLADAPPPLTPERLAAISVPVLVVAQDDDPVHPVDAAQLLARQLPNVTLVTFPAGGLLTSHRGEVRDVIREFADGRLILGTPAATLPRGCDR